MVIKGTKKKKNVVNYNNNKFIPNLMTTSFRKQM